MNNKIEQKENLEGGGGTTNTPTGNGGTTFVCSKCGNVCDCGNMSAEEGVCIYCYCSEPDDPPNPSEGGTTFVCSKCGNVCDCGNMSAEEGICICCYCPTPDIDEEEKNTPFFCTECEKTYESNMESEDPTLCKNCYAALHTPPVDEENGGTEFECRRCHRICKCGNMSIEYGVCIECYRKGDTAPEMSDIGTAATISDESYTSGYICCAGAVQWFKFVATRTGQYTICTTGNLNTIGTLYDCNGNLIDEVDDYAPCGKINFRIICNLTEGNTYYVKVGDSDGNVGSYTLCVTERVFADCVNINQNTITLEKGVTYELPIAPNYIYKGYNGAQRIPGLSVSITPSNANEQKILWTEQDGDVLKCSYGWDDDGDRYIHVTATEIGTTKLYARDWNENGKRDECSVTVIMPYAKRLQEIGGFSSEATNLILKLYSKVDNLFASESTLQKAWKCARLLSEFTYDSFSFNDVAGSLTNPKNRKSYFTNTLGYTENEYNTLEIALSDNHDDGNTIDFTHLQYSLAARLAYTLDKDGFASNLGSQFKTGNWDIYSDEDISYLGGWLGDATLRNNGATGVTILKNDDYMSDLDAENVYRLILQGYASIDALNVYYSNMNSSNTRANIFLQYIPYSTVKQKIFYELIDADLYMSLSNASNQGNVVLVNYYWELINNEQYHYDTIKSKYHDTYDFLMSLNDQLLTLSHYQ